MIIIDSIAESCAYYHETRQHAFTGEKMYDFKESNDLYTLSLGQKDPFPINIQTSLQSIQNYPDWLMEVYGRINKAYYDYFKIKSLIEAKPKVRSLTNVLYVTARTHGNFEAEKRISEMFRVSAELEKLQFGSKHTAFVKALIKELDEEGFDYHYTNQDGTHCLKIKAKTF